MSRTNFFSIFVIVLFLGGCEQKNRQVLQGLQQPVEVLRDPWGINHIYAENEHDLFFTQGYCAARDRLFQFEVWRRQAMGTVAEILGERELKRDIGTRLFLFRHDIQAEMNHYHPRGAEIITAFVEGVNAYIEEALLHPELLPLEFQLLGITPQPWRPEVVISRHQGLLGNVGEELNTGRAVALLGEEKVLDLSDFHPGTPDLTLDKALDEEVLFEDILELYEAFRQPVNFLPEDLHTGRATTAIESSPPILAENFTKEVEVVGSNNWVLSGALTESGYPLMANDPHRALAVPSLRYWAHLVAPGWNVIGGGEPEIPGISIGHNEYGAWGLTVFETDGEDLYFYETHPEDPLQYQHEGTWKTMEVITDTIPVKGREPEIVELKYTIHGPVIYEATEKNVAIALRCAWMEIGGSPYLASLRMDQAQTWEEFRDACAYSHIPGENMVWADREGNIGWQAVGIAPVRPHWSGLVPVPGNGQYEWDGYLPIKEKPHIYNPESGYKATANENQVPSGYPHRNAMSYSWSSPYRALRIDEVLKKETPFSIDEMKSLQTDYLSIPARELVPLLESIVLKEEKYDKARNDLLSWDYVMDTASVPAGIYRAWESQLYDSTEKLFFPAAAREYLYLSITKMIQWLKNPENRQEFGANPVAGRDAFLAENLKKAIEALEQKLGTTIEDWQYGQIAYHHVLMHHPLSNAVNDSLKNVLEVGPVPRGGYGYTVGATGMSDNQRSGATFRLIVDTGDWDKAIGMNAPGQSGDPSSPYYKNLFTDWAKDDFFPVYYSREKVEEVAEERVMWVDE